MIKKTGCLERKEIKIKLKLCPIVCNCIHVVDRDCIQQFYQG